VVGTDVIGQMIYGPWKGQTYSGASVVMDVSVGLQVGTPSRRGSPQDAFQTATGAMCLSP
jgi:hypothetical protein